MAGGSVARAGLAAAVAAVVGVLAAALIISGLVSSWTSSDELTGEASPPTAAPQSQPTGAQTGQPAPSASPSPATTSLPYEQLRGQIRAVLRADGGERAFALLVDAVAASAQAAGMCPRLAADLAQEEPEVDWRAACS